MKTLIMALVVSQLTACGLLGAFYDSNNKCLQTELIKTGQYPSYCGAGSGYALTTRDYRTGNYQSYTTVRKN